MSTFQQFFPGGGSSGGSSRIHLEVLAVSGGGGAGAGPQSASAYIFCRSGGGGGGAAYLGRLDVEPGSSVPITIGGGGAAGCYPNATGCCTGSRGGDTVVKYPEGTIRVMGGGGGLHCGANGVDPASPAHGGTGGGGGGHGAGVCKCTWVTCSFPTTNSLKVGLTGRGSGRSIYARGNAEMKIYCQLTNCSFLKMEWNGETSMAYGNGAFYGAPGNLTMQTTGTPTACPTIIPGSGGGGAGGQGFLSQCGPSGANQCINEVAGPGIFTEMTGTMEEFGSGGLNHSPCMPSACLPSPANSAMGGSNIRGATQQAGGSGVVIIRYPTDFSAAPVATGATLCTPVTPGYHTYRFNSTGSITLP